MRKTLLAVLLSCAIFLAGNSGILFAGRGPAPSDPGEDTTLKPSLPPSLDSLYPPKTPQPVFLFQMLALGNAFTGIISDFMAGDVKNAGSNLEAFKALYGQISKLVPEWTDRYPSGPLAELEQSFRSSLQSKDPSMFMGAVGKLGGVCSACHHDLMAAVQHKYHWNRSADVKVKDPQSGQMIGYGQLMQILNFGFAGSWADFGQGQTENAEGRFKEFNAAYQLLKGACQDCHGTSERKYYIDGEAQALVDAYGRALAVGSSEAKKAESAMMAVGNEICFKCHLVHIPAAHSKHR